VPFILSELIAERIGFQIGFERMLRAYLRAKFGAEGEALLAGRELTFTEESATALVKKLLPATTLEEARLAFEAD
jgi:hypothetical protein